MHRGYNRLYALGKYSPVQASSALEQLCTYIQHAITAALAQGQPSTPSTSTQAPHTPPSQPPTPAATAQQQQEQATAQLVLPETPSQTPPPPIQAVISPIMDFILAAATSASQGMQASAVLRLLKLAQALVDAMQQQRCKAGAGQVEMLMGSDSAVGKLRYSINMLDVMHTCTPQAVAFCQHDVKLAVNCHKLDCIPACPCLC